MEILKNQKFDVREKALAHGLCFPFDEELIMLILGSGSHEIPVDVMAGRIVQVLNDSEEEDIVKNLMNLKGVGESKALAIAAALELGRRKYSHLRAVINSAEDLIPFVRNYAVSTKEHFLAITLTGGHEIIQIHVISVGTLDKTLIHPRDIFSVAIKENAAALIVCHNHPSGNCQPSKEDIKTTRILYEVSKIIGIHLLDHIIIDCNTYFSFLQNSLVFNEKLNETDETKERENSE